MATLTAREEDYLETIYRLTQAGMPVGVTEVAKARQVTVPTVRTAVTKLARYGLVRQEHYGKITLRSAGRRQAEEIYAVHRALLRFLNEVLLLEPEIAEQEACGMEHSLSKETLRRLVLFLEAWERSDKRDSSCLKIFQEVIAE